MDFLSSPPDVDGTVLHELEYDGFFDQLMLLGQDNSLNEPSTTMNDNADLVQSTPAPEPSQPRYWKANLNPPAGREGETPYLTLDKFATAEQLLGPYNDQIDGETIFTSMQESVDWRSRQLVDHRPEFDQTIPRDRLRKQACVKTLFKAFKSTATATDNPGMKKPFDEERHDNARVECLCWMLLEALIRRSESGPLLVSYDPAKTKENVAIQSFAVRFDEVVHSLREQKTICKHLLDAPYINTFVDDPVRARNRVASNRDLNRKKGDAMNLGKEQLRKGSRQGTTRSKIKKRTRSVSTDGEISDEPSTLFSHSPATLYSTPSLSTYHPQGRSMNGNGSSSQYTSTSMRSGYGSSELNTYSPAGLQMNARAPPISYSPSPTPSYSFGPSLAQRHTQSSSYSTSPTPGHNFGPSLAQHNTQSSSGQSMVQSPALTTLEQQQQRAMYDNYNNIIAQTMPAEWVHPPSSVSRANLMGVGEQFPLLNQPTFPTSSSRFIPNAARRHTYGPSPQDHGR